MDGVPEAPLSPGSTGSVVPGASRGHAGFRSYLRFIGTFRGSILVVVGAFGLASGLLAVVPIFVGRLVETLSEKPVPAAGAYRYAAVLIACNVGHDLLWRGGEVLFLRLLNHRGYEYENLLFRNVITEPYPYFVNKFTGKISSYIGTLGREFRAFLDACCYTYVDQLVKVPVIAVIMFSVNLYSGVVFAGSILLMATVGRWTVPRTARAEMRAADLGSETDGYLIDVISNFVSVKSFRREEAEDAEVRRRRRKVIAAANRSALWNIIFWASMSLVVRYLVWPATILINLHMFLRGDVTLAQFATFLSALVLFSDYIWGTVWQISQLNLQLARVEEAYHYLFGDRDILRTPATLGTPGSPGSPGHLGSHGHHGHHRSPGPAEAIGPMGVIAPRTPVPEDAPRRSPRGPVTAERLQLRRLTFAYPEAQGEPVLSEISLAIGRNEKIGIVGPSGSGKTTLIKLLLGYYVLPLGMVAMDGAAVPNRRLAHDISYVPQDTTLFHRSIAANIRYGAAAGATQADVERAARRAHAHDFISRTREGYDTLVGERGIKLSTGQRQRIAIARAFLDDKPMLILDEATSALDSESEVLVQHALEELWQDKTVIAVAHRLSTLLHMDRIVVLEAGRIMEQGSHQELLDQQGRYHRLWQRQSGGMLAVD